ncbi:MAG TPA: acyl-CoA dehydrogenase family protein [Geminicoccus sp.]|nr:acyl-CoA dehydrogenase family protein [Geminicoccus sp.]HEX2525088.1 acyl-CoA dehydrogenase family protein [Geminicoccus sp.]
MIPFTPPVADQLLTLQAVLGSDLLPGLDDELVEQLLREGGRFAAGVLAPLNQVGDREGTWLDNGVVRTATGFADAWRQFTEAGWLGLPFPDEFGGQGLPWTVATAVADSFNAANLTWYLAPLLTQGAIEALLHHASDELKARYLQDMVTGVATGAMCLTEPQAGSDLGALRARAVPADNGSYRITGQKIYITFGDHDFTEQVVHLVLARLPDAPEGSRGISLFLVPKRLPDGSRNDWRVAGLEKKLGIHGSPTCVIAYGDHGGATGWLVGAPHAGLKCMFTMMNNARLNVGVEGLGIAERALQAASAYAAERRQGKRGGATVPIGEHPDVALTITRMQATTSAARGICYLTAAALDRGDQTMAGLLTPIAKAWCTDRAVELASDAIQVHGGMGFVEETGVAQLLRDARILPIYEGTNGIQAQDLVLRKLPQEDGQTVLRLFGQIRARLPALALGEEIGASLDVLEASTRSLRTASADDQAAAASLYLTLIGNVVGGWLLAEKAALGDLESDRLARFWAARVLVQAQGQAAAIASGAAFIR